MICTVSLPCTVVGEGGVRLRKFVVPPSGSVMADGEVPTGELFFLGCLSIIVIRFVMLCYSPRLMVEL